MPSSIDGSGDPFRLAGGASNVMGCKCSADGASSEFGAGVGDKNELRDRLLRAWRSSTNRRISCLRFSHASLAKGDTVADCGVDVKGDPDRGVSISTSMICKVCSPWDTKGRPGDGR